jgi:dTDP-4-dehydrorhamnose reductase
MLAHALKGALDAKGVRYNAVTRSQWDIGDAPQVELMFEDFRPTLVLNCAAYTKVDPAEAETDSATRVNRDGARHLAEACAASSAKLIHFSTDYVFDGTVRRPLRPDDPVGPTSAYGKSKLAGEQAIQKVPGFDYLIIRTAWLYGPNGPNFVKTMVNAAKAGKPLRVVNDQVGSPTYTLDLAAATLALVDHGARGIWHLSNSGETTWFDFARAIFQEWGMQPDLQSTTSDAWKAGRANIADRPAYSVLDVTPFAKLTGHPIRHWREALSAFRAEVSHTGAF